MELFQCLLSFFLAAAAVFAVTAQDPPEQQPRSPEDIHMISLGRSASASASCSAPQVSNSVLSNLTIINPGFGVNLAVSAVSKNESDLKGGGLEGQYRLELLRLHRGICMPEPGGPKDFKLFVHLVFRKSTFDLAIVTIEYLMDVKNETGADGTAGNLTDLLTEIRAPGNESVVKSVRIEDFFRGGNFKFGCPSPTFLFLDTPFGIHNISWVQLRKYLTISKQQLSIFNQTLELPSFNLTLGQQFFFRSDVLYPNRSELLSPDTDNHLRVSRAASTADFEALDTAVKDNCEHCRSQGTCSLCKKTFAVLSLENLARMNRRRRGTGADRWAWPFQSVPDGWIVTQAKHDCQYSPLDC